MKTNPVDLSGKFKMSCEPKRTKAYSADLRWRIVYQVEGLKKSCRTVAQNLCVDLSTVSRTVSLFNTSGNVEKKIYPPNTGTASLTEIDKIIILETIAETPAVFLREIQQTLIGTNVDTSTIWKSLNITRQNMVLVAKQRSELLRAEYLLDMQVFRGHPQMFVFVDETGADRRNCLRRYGYSIRGRPAVSTKLLVRGQRVSAIAAISMEGLLDCYTYTTSVAGDNFKHYVRQSLLQQLKPFNGSNPHSVVVLDNASIHHANGVVDLIESTGALVHFLPPYSPDLNPIEEAFSKVKSTLKANEYLLDIFDIESFVLHAFTSITVDNCNQWVQHSGYI